MTQSRAGAVQKSSAPTPSGAPASGQTTPAKGGRPGLRGASFASGEAALTPPDGPPSGGGGATGKVQKKAVQMDAAKDKKDAQGLEKQDRAQNDRAGHALDRHGPEVEENALKRRLVTGYAPDGEFVPAPGYATKFNTYADYLATRNAAVHRMKVQGKQLLKDMEAVLAAYESVCQEFDAAQGAARGPIVPRRTAAANAVQTYAQRFPVGQRMQSCIAISFRANHDKPRECLILRTRYEVGINHGRSIGMGYQGTGQRQVQNPRTGEATDVSATVKRVDEITRTRTLFLPPADTVLTPTWDPSQFTVMQHFPDPAIAVGIES
ncbi:MAG: hypothetical protein U1F43_28810 [Myxococcota bacterium]